MTRRRLGDGVILERVREERAVLRQSRQAPGELTAPAVDVVRPHLIDRQEDDQRRASRRGALRTGRSRRQEAGGERKRGEPAGGTSRHANRCRRGEGAEPPPHRDAHSVAIYIMR
jgi:hypothetical protein